MDAAPVEVRNHERAALVQRASRWEAFVARRAPIPLSYHPAWLDVLARGFQHQPICLEAVQGETCRGLLPLAFVKSQLFGRFLIGLPYLNYGGVLADDEETPRLLIDHAIELADRLEVDRLELRHERALDHPQLTPATGHKYNVRRNLPATSAALWKSLESSVRNQIRKGRRGGLKVAWGGEELLPEFYDVFSHNMRDLGTPTFGQRLFRAILCEFPGLAEFCVVRAGELPVAAALLTHGWGVTEVPSASSLRRFNSTCANMLLYWHLLECAVGRGQSQFDFGRSTPGSPVMKFKEQWGGRAEPAEWQCYVRSGGSDPRCNGDRYRRFVWLWRHLPVALTRWIGPSIVRGMI